MDNIVLTHNIITFQLRVAQFMNRCRMFLLNFGKPYIGNTPQRLPYWDAKYWF